MGINLSGATPTTPGAPGGILQAIQDAIESAGGIGGVLAGAITSIVSDITGAIGGLIGMVADMLSLGRADTHAVDLARVAAENAIANAMSSSLDHMDESVRAGGAYMAPTDWRLIGGDDHPHVMPLTDGFNVASGVAWLPRTIDTIGDDWLANPSTTTARLQKQGEIAMNSGALELLEGGFWLIFFQVAVRNATGWGGSSGAMRSWCYVTPVVDDRCPVGSPDGSTVATYDRITGAYDEVTPVTGLVKAYGRSTGYISSESFPGGFTQLGLAPAYLESGGYKVTLATQHTGHYGGAASTFVWAFKVNTETLRADLDALKAQIAADLPGQEVALQLTPEAIEDMRLAAQDIPVGQEEP